MIPVTSAIAPSAWVDWLQWFIARAEAFVLNPSILRTYGLVGVILAITFVLEIAAKKEWRVRYGSRNFRIDTFYYIFYYGGAYQFFVWGWMYKLLSQAFAAYLPWLQLNIISGLSQTMQIVALMVVFDFFHYWNHRLRHAIPWFWAFHSIHHSQTKMTMMSAFRFHFVDETLFRLLMFIPFQILGFSPYLLIWLWADVVVTWITGVEHSEFPWTYGPIGRIVVSPYFHRIHHTADERHANRNFGGVFSFWDDLFGTAERNVPIPTEHGLSGHPVPETLFGQLIYPFTLIWRDLRGGIREIPPVEPSQRQASTSRIYADV